MVIYLCRITVRLVQELLEENFLGSVVLSDFSFAIAQDPRTPPSDFYIEAIGTNEDIQHFARLAYCVNSSSKTPLNQCLNINRLSIAYAFRPRLRID